MDNKDDKKWLSKREKDVQMIAFILIVAFCLVGVIMYYFLCVSVNYLESEEVKKELTTVLKQEINESDKKIRFNGETGYIWTVSAGDTVNSFSYEFEYNENKYDIRSFVQIKSQEISIGPKSISIGMKKDEVIRILKNSRQTTSSPTIDVYVLDEYGEVTKRTIENYYDDNWWHWIGFVYDNEDYVKYIFVGLGI